MDDNIGYIHVYTGNGKGKTTAALGLAIRAIGADKNVLIIQFMKSKIYSEHNILPFISPKLSLVTVGKPFFIAKEGSLTEEEKDKYKDSCVIYTPGHPPQEYINIIKQGIKMAKAATSSGEYDLVILDEINCALYFELISWNEVEGLIKNKSKATELVLTGRGAPQDLIDMADLVTEMKEIKHYYSKGIMARKGIDN